MMDRSRRRSQKKHTDKKPGSKDIPGYYCCPETGKYYRLPLPPGFKVVSPKTADIPDCSKEVKELVRLPVLFWRREIDGSSLTFTRQVNHCRVRLMRVKNAFTLPFNDHGTYCDGVIGDSANTFCGLWYTPARRCFSFTAFDIVNGDYLRSSYVTTPVDSKSVTDFVFRENSQTIRTILATEVDDDTTYIPCALYMQYGMLPQYLFVDAVLACNKDITFSVAYNVSSQLAAFGTTRGVKIMHIETNMTAFINLNERIHSLSYHEGSGALFAGGHRGNLYHCDGNKQRKYASKVKTGNHLLCHIQAFDVRGNLYVACSGYESYLALIDVCAEKEVLQYQGHVNKDRRVRFSIDTELYILSATGQDGHTRLWDLFTGEMVLDLEPPDGFDHCQFNFNVHSVLRGPSHGCCNPYLLIVYGARVYIYEA